MVILNRRHISLSNVNRCGCYMQLSKPIRFTTWSLSGTSLGFTLIDTVQTLCRRAFNLYLHYIHQEKMFLKKAWPCLESSRNNLSVDVYVIRSFHILLWPLSVSFNLLTWLTGVSWSTQEYIAQGQYDSGLQHGGWKLGRA